MDYKLKCWTEFKKIVYYSTGLRQLAEQMIIPWKRYEELTSIEIDEMIKIIDEYYIELLIIDMDGTLKHYQDGLLECNKKWIEEMKEYVRIHIITNSGESYTKEVADALDIPYLCSAKKPLPIGFKKILEQEHVDKDKAILIGDAAVTDIFGAHNAGIEKTILLDDISVKRKHFIKY